MRLKKGKMVTAEEAVDKMRTSLLQGSKDLYGKILTLTVSLDSESCA